MTDYRQGALARLNRLEPLMTRASIVSAFGILGMVLNNHFADGTVEYTGNIILSAFSLLTAIVTRPAVTPNSKAANHTDL